MCLFPSLSGKSSIRTSAKEGILNITRRVVSIPFREELHSDSKYLSKQRLTRNNVSIPFREELHSDKSWCRRQTRWRVTCFHPFQGRAPFGLQVLTKLPVTLTGDVSIPFREELHSDKAEVPTIDAIINDSFHPFQGRAPFGPSARPANIAKPARIVSIPFREELHSDRAIVITGAPGVGKVSIPFREELHSD